MRLLVFLLLVFLAYQWWTFARRQLRRNDPPPEKTRRGEDMVRDPQCGTYVPKGDAVTSTIRGDRVHFCSKACRDAYLDRS